MMQEFLNRYYARKNQDSANFGSSILKLAEVLKGDAIPALDAASGNKLAEACQGVLTATGFNIKIKPELDSTEIQDLVSRYGAQANAAVRPVQLMGEDWWKDDCGPLLVFIGVNKTPSIFISSRRGAYVVDGVTRKTTKVDEDFAKTFAQIAYMFFRPLPDKKISLLDLLKFGFKGTGPDFINVFVTGILGGVLGLLVPFATGRIMDILIPNAERQTLVQVILVLVASAAGVASFELARSISMLRIEGRMGNVSQSAIIFRLLKLPPPFFKNYSAGDLGQRAFGIDGILRIFTGTTQVALLGWIFGIISLVYIFSIDSKLAYLGMGIVGISLTFTLFINIVRLSLERVQYNIQGKISGLVLQLINGISKLRSCGAESRGFDKWAGDFSIQKSIDYRLTQLKNRQLVFDAGFSVVSTMFIFAMLSIFGHPIEVGKYMAFSAAFSQFFLSTVSIGAALTSSLSAIPLFERARPILDALPEVADDKKDPGPIDGSVELSNITFSYEGEGPVVLSNLSFSIEPNEFVAIVGASGSGKSTIFRLLLGFEIPTSGIVFLNNQNLKKLDITAVRKQLGVVLQSGTLMPASIFRNIVGSNPLTIDDAWRAAEMAGIADDIKVMPMGMQTFIAEGAGTISGGQHQRLLIARAFAGNPKMILFDEATSALDNETQAIVYDSLNKLKVTKLIIAHRLSTIQNADRILVIDQGRLVEQGKYDDLVNQNGVFADLIKRQVL